jgi:hypothetical protein
MLPSGKALVDVDKITHAVPEGQGTRLYSVRSTSTFRTRSTSWRTYSPDATGRTLVSTAAQAFMCVDRSPLGEIEAKLIESERPRHR